MSSSIPVLIVGAGPTGLTMACEMARYNIPCRIIEKRAERTQTSNALGIQTRTLELFDDLKILDRFLQAGNKIKTLQLHSDNKKFPKVSVEQIDSVYPFILTLPQSETERILEERLNELGVTVERSTELIELHQSKNQIVTKIKNANNTEETITADWLIACDGSHSLVREKLNIPFIGEDIPQQFLVADVNLKTKLPDTEINVFFDKESIFALFPITGKRFRIIANNLDERKTEFSEGDISEIVKKRSRDLAEFISTNWVSPFYIHSKLIDRMRHQSIFLAGDASHIHSPAGGQGMNTGIQDAYNLAWKLALVINKKVAPSILDSYHEERHPIIKDIVKQTRLMTKMILLKNPLSIWVRNFFLKAVMGRQSLSHKVLMRMTQLSLRYTNSPIINYHSVMSHASPQPGERAPDVKINDNQSLADLLRGTEHHILLFTGLKLTQHEISQLKNALEKIKKHHAKVIKVFVIAHEEIEALKDVDYIIDTNLAIHQRYNVKFPGIYVIRPDNYIAFCASHLEPLDLKNLTITLSYLN